MGKRKRVDIDVNKKALLIGINYRGTSSELKGCINDVNNMKTYLVSQGFTDITVITDDTEIKPTKSNILKYLFELVHSEKPTLFFHYSGHGSHTADTADTADTGRSKRKDLDESDGQDESLVPIDYQSVGMINDDQLRAMLEFMNPGSTLTAVLDCCHSGSAMDLCWNYNPVQKELVPKGGKETPGQVVLISGCQDPQTSADAHEEGSYQGALTYCILKSLPKSNNIFELIDQVLVLLKKRRYSQIANLTFGKDVVIPKGEFEFP